MRPLRKVTGVVVKQYQALVPSKDFAKLELKDDSGIVIQTFNDQSEAIKQHREGVIRLIHMQLGGFDPSIEKANFQATGIGIFTFGR